MDYVSSGFRDASQKYFGEATPSQKTEAGGEIDSAALGLSFAETISPAGAGVFSALVAQCRSYPSLTYSKQPAPAPTSHRGSVLRTT